MVAHELGHSIHYNLKQAVDELDFNTAKMKTKLSKELENVIKIAKQEIKEKGGAGVFEYNFKLKNSKLPKDNPLKFREKVGDVLDTLGDLTKGKYGNGHTKSYYKESYGMEFFAHLSEGNDVFKNNLPKTYKAGNEYFKKLLND